MHPRNASALRPAKIDYASLANNHTLDFCNEGLFETMKTLKYEGVQFGGVGEDAQEACAPTVLSLSGEEGAEHDIEIFSASDHPKEWSTVPGFHLIDYSQQTRDHLKQILTVPRPDHIKLHIFSVHWGPNYSWQAADEVRSLAHYLIDECEVDIIHGRSSHHVQGAELYKGKLIIYGCGDFIDDYATIKEYRNDLSALWQETVQENEDGHLQLAWMRVFPTRIKRYQVQLLDKSDQDYKWACTCISKLSERFDTKFTTSTDPRGPLVLLVNGMLDADKSYFVDYGS